MSDNRFSRTLCGFSDFDPEFNDQYIGGPIKPRKPTKPTPGRSAGGRPTAGGKGTIKAGTATLYGKAVPTKPNPTFQRHGQTIQTAKVTAQKAVQVAAAAFRKAPKFQAKPSSAILARTVVGLVASGRPLNAKQKAALARQKQAAAKAAAASKTAVNAGRAVRTSAIKLAQTMQKQRATALAIRKAKPGSTRIKGLDFIGYDYLGASPDPLNPGWLDDGSPDPAIWGTDPAAGDVSLDPLNDAFAAAVEESPPVQLPPPPPMDVQIADYATVGGIPYDFSKGKPVGFVGSYGYFAGTTIVDTLNKAKNAAEWMFNPFGAMMAYAGGTADHYGFVWGGNKGDSNWPGEDPNQWIEVHGRRHHRDWWNDAGGWDQIATISQQSMSKANPNGVGFGPLVGNPAMPDWAKMRVDSKGVCFWFPQEAPDWVTFPLKQAEALTEQQNRKTAEDTRKANQALLDKQTAEAALQQAQQDAANALAESQEASAAAIADSQAETAASQLLLEQGRQEQEQRAAEAAAAAEERRFMMEQAQADRAQQAADMEMYRQAQQFDLEAARQEQQLMLEQARAEQAYLAQNPEVAYGPQGGGYGPPQGYAEDGGGYDGSGIVPNYGAYEGEGFDVLPEGGGGYIEDVLVGMDAEEWE